MLNIAPFIGQVIKLMGGEGGALVSHGEAMIFPKDILSNTKDIWREKHLFDKMTVF